MMHDIVAIGLANSTSSYLVLEFILNLPCRANFVEHTILSYSTSTTLDNQKNIILLNQARGPYQHSWTLTFTMSTFRQPGLLDQPHPHPQS